MSVVTKVLREAYKGVVSVYSQIAQGNNALLSLCSGGRFALAQGVVSLRFTIACVTRALFSCSVWEARLHGSQVNYQYYTAAGVILECRTSISDEGIALLCRA